ncbi:MAG: hypothetical protein U0V75_18080 [Ferruginibacter sp.]
MKKFFSIDISKKELLAFVVILVWITASFFVPLPPVNSLGW